MQAYLERISLDARVLGKIFKSEEKTPKLQKGEIFVRGKRVEFFKYDEDIMNKYSIDSLNNFII